MTNHTNTHSPKPNTGLRESIVDFSGNVPGTTPKDVMDLLLLTQYMDMLSTIGNNPSSTTVFTPHKFGGVQIEDQVRDGSMQASKLPPGLSMGGHRMAR